MRRQPGWPLCRAAHRVGAVLVPPPLRAASLTRRRCALRLLLWSGVLVARKGARRAAVRCAIDRAGPFCRQPRDALQHAAADADADADGRKWRASCGNPRLTGLSPNGPWSLAHHLDRQLTNQRMFDPAMQTSTTSAQPHRPSPPDLAGGLLQKERDAPLDRDAGSAELAACVAARSLDMDLRLHRQQPRHLTGGQVFRPALCPRRCHLFWNGPDNCRQETCRSPKPIRKCWRPACSAERFRRRARRVQWPRTVAGGAKDARPEVDRCASRNPLHPPTWTMQGSARQALVKTRAPL